MNQLSKKLMCVQMRSGVEMWMEYDRALTLQNILQKITGHKFIIHDDQTINTADIVGIFTAENMADHTRRKNGQWQCASNNWHARGEKCECASLEDKKLIERRAQAIKACRRGCVNGYQKTPTGMVLCDCVKNIK